MTQQELQALLFDGLDLDTGGLADKLWWKAANLLRSNSGLKSSEYATPVLGLIFLKYADNKFQLAEETVKSAIKPFHKEEDRKKLYIANCGFYLPENARYSYLLEGKYRAESEGKKTLQKAIIEAMEAIESFNENLEGTLPKQQYTAIDDDSILENLLKEFSVIPVDAEGDLFGRIYEYFLGKFAMAEGQKGGQFFTPTSIVKLIVEVIEPFRGKIFDPSCGSGGMFVQSAKFIKRNQRETNQISLYGQERMKDTVDLSKINLAVNGLDGDIRNVNSFYEDPFEIDAYIEENGTGKFDYVMANPPFNVKDVSIDKIKEQSTRFGEYGLPMKPEKPKSKKKESAKKDNKPKTFGNANYLWANLFASSLNETGRAGFVMANSASDARSQELEIRTKIVEDGIVDVIVAVASNFFLSVTLPITLWFYDKGKPETRQDKTLFIDARNIYTQVSRAIRTFTQSQLYNITALVWLYRGEQEKYDALISSYKTALARWTDDIIANPKNSDLPFEGITKAESECRAALANLKGKLQTWYKLVKDDIDTDEIDQEFDFVMPLERIDPSNIKAAYKKLQELTKIAERKLKPKKDKNFKQYGIKERLQAATTAYEHQQFIQERIAYFQGHIDWHEKRFPDGSYQDVEGLCKIAELAEIREQNYSLNAGRYVGVALEEDNTTPEEFKAEMLELHQQLQSLNTQAADLETLIDKQLKEVL